MKWLVVAVVFSFMAVWTTGCAPLGSNPSIYSGSQEATVVFHPSDSNNLLSCLQESQGLSRGDFTLYYKQVAEKKELGGDAESLRFVCLSLHKYASYNQFKEGLAVFDQYVEEHPDERTSLMGLSLLMKRIKKEKINRWSQRNKLMDEREVLEDENRELLETVAELEKTIEQDQSRISELQKQIEQLKNIENIIKNREL